LEADDMAYWRRTHDARELGRGIADLRKVRGMTQEELAEWLGVDRTTVVRLEAGSTGPLRRLMEALSILGADIVIAERTANVTVMDSSAMSSPEPSREPDLT
jgi:DNA-binding XRE family transcriptional regulator